jgi:3'(2'), 5'-bisphosphate nucleotidase
VGDQAADGYLQGILAGRYAEDGILSEETASDPHRLSKSRVWIVDPLDGTKEFGERREDWAVHVALAIDGSCALGAVALPATGEVLWADGDRRASRAEAGAWFAGIVKEAPSRSWP